MSGNERRARDALDGRADEAECRRDGRRASPRDGQGIGDQILLPNDQTGWLVRQTVGKGYFWRRRFKFDYEILKTADGLDLVCASV